MTAPRTRISETRTPESRTLGTRTPEARGSGARISGARVSETPPSRTTARAPAPPTSTERVRFDAVTVVAWQLIAASVLGLAWVGLELGPDTPPRPDDRLLFSVGNEASVGNEGADNPPDSPADSFPPPTVRVIVVGDEVTTTIRVEGRGPAPRDEVASQLGSLAEAVPDVTVILEAEPTIPLVTLLEIASSLAEAGVSDVRLGRLVRP